ncbi:MFS transporter [Luteipulveratus mongoliensis]|uniref:MFS transporter n=1 Tax=Luteipulveratus mongoliensis TaxID=571913 RepID=A0A0K1JM63_9MICO|nr:MFS transporter [Luteipulveratus mongoliensis]AKU17802.1 MFS transporter [Luteipulveratus mongoliensis]
MKQLAILMFCVFSVTTGEFAVAGILPDVAADLGVPVGQAGLLITAYAAGMIIGGPVLTALTTGASRKPLMLALLGVAVVGNIGSALAPTFATVLAARVLTALVTSTFFAQAMVLAVRLGPPERAATAVARLALGMSLAMVIGAPIGTVIGHHWGWRATFGGIGVACLAGLLLVARAVTDPEPGERRGSAIGELRVLRRRPVIGALAVTAVGNVGVLMVFSYLAPLMTEVAGRAANGLPMLLLAYGVGATVGNLLGGFVFDRRPQSALPLLLGALAVALVVSWLVATSPLPGAAAVVVIGALGFAVIPGMQARVMSAAADAPTLAMAVNASGYQVAAAAAGLIGGLITDSGAGPRPIYLVAAVLTACGLALSSWTARQSERSTLLRRRTPEWRTTR